MPHVRSGQIQTLPNEVALSVQGQEQTLGPFGDKSVIIVHLAT